MRPESRFCSFALISILLALLCALPVAAGCASDDMKGMGEAANKAAAGDASGRAGSVDSKIVGGYMPGDIYSPDVKAQRNVTASTAGPQYQIGSIAAAGGADALQRAIAADPSINEIREQLEAEKALPPDQRSPERLAALRAELAARVKELGEQAGRASPQITVSGNTMFVIAPSATGTNPPVTTDADAKSIGEIPGIIHAINEAHAGLSKPTSQPSEPVNGVVPPSSPAPSPAINPIPLPPN